MPPGYNWDELPELLPDESIARAARIRLRLCKEMVYYRAGCSKSMSNLLGVAFNNILDKQSSQWWIDNCKYTGAQLLHYEYSNLLSKGAGSTSPAPDLDNYLGDGAASPGPVSRRVIQSSANAGAAPPANLYPRPEQIK